MEPGTVRCTACDQPNPSGMSFCGYCASPLPRRCPSCGQISPAGMRFCGYCASPLGDTGGFPASNSSVSAGVTGALPPTAPSYSGPDLAPETTPFNSSMRDMSSSTTAERRLVTALFCDLVGFTPLSEALDPEDVRDLQARYFSAMSKQVERYGGVVEKYAGDAVLALFGAPVAHEDDAERAVLCALGMQAAIEPVADEARRRWNAEPAIRVGVNTGDVVSGSWDASGRQDVAVTGDAIHTGARRQAVAGPGEVLASEETMRLTRRRIHYGQKRDLVLKGKLGTYSGYPALGLREEFGERWHEAPRVSPLVGRDREMVELFDAWVRAQGGEGQLITLVGDPGVGKSRLMTEFLEKMAASSSIRVLRARCLSYGQEISLWLIADLLRSLFGMREQEGLDSVQTQLESGVRWLLQASDLDTRTEALDVQGEVLGLPAGGSMVANAGPQIRRHALLRSLRLVLAAL